MLNQQRGQARKDARDAQKEAREERALAVQERNAAAQGRRIDAEIAAMSGKSAGYRTLSTPEERAAAGVPADYKGVVQLGPDNKVYMPGKAATEVNLTQNAESASSKKLGEKVGEIFGGMYDEGVQAGDEIAQIGRLRGLLQKGQGLGAGLNAWAARSGIKLSDNADAAQAADAMINYMIPRQRVPGSGTSSDRDMAAFRASLPTLTGTPEGNELILNTMQGLADSKRARGDIAARVAAGELTPAQGLEEIKKLPNPFDQFRAMEDTIKKNSAPPPKTTVSQPQQQGGRYQEGQTAHNPATGETVIFRNGRWEPLA